MGQIANLDEEFDDDFEEQEAHRKRQRERQRKYRQKLRDRKEHEQKATEDHKVQPKSEEKETTVPNVKEKCPLRRYEQNIPVRQPTNIPVHQPTLHNQTSAKKQPTTNITKPGDTSVQYTSLNVNNFASDSSKTTALPSLNNIFRTQQIQSLPQLPSLSVSIPSYPPSWRPFPKTSTSLPASPGRSQPAPTTTLPPFFHLSSSSNSSSWGSADLAVILHRHRWNVTTSSNKASLRPSSLSNMNASFFLTLASTRNRWEDQIPWRF